MAGDKNHEPTRLNPSRYAGFDHDDDNELSSILPPRRATREQHSAEPAATTSDGESHNASIPDALPAHLPDKPEPEPPAQRSQKKKGTKSKGATATAEPPSPAVDNSEPAESELAGHEDARWSSMAHADADLIDKIRQMAQQRNWSTGEIILTAVSETYENGRLAGRLNEGDVTSNLFGTWRTRVASRDRPPKTPLNFNLLIRHRDVMDRLVDELNANSRSELIRTALELYFTPEDDT